MRYLNFGIMYDPELVILAFFTGNDFRNNSKFLNRESVGFYYESDHNHNLVLNRSLVDAYDNRLTYPKRLFQKLKAKSHLLSLISERVYLFRHQFLQTRLAEAHGDKESARDDKQEAVELVSDLNIYRRDLAPSWKEAVEISKGIILNFKRSVEEHGGQFLLLGISNAEQVHPEVESDWKNQYKIDFDYGQPDRILEEFAGEHGVLFLKLMPAFRDYHLRTGQYLHGFGLSHAGHWNQAGHHLAAEVTFQFLKDQHMVPLESKTS